MRSIVRIGLSIVGIVLIGLSVGYFLQISWVVRTWPWPDKSLSYAFIASMQAAIAAACIWIAITGELGVMAAGALNLLVMMGGLAIYFGLLALDATTSTQLIITYALVCALFAAFNFLLFRWARRIPIRDQRALPLPVRISYIIFVLLLALVGGALIFQGANTLPFDETSVILPWDVDKSVAVVFGWMFLGDAFYFLYALLQSRWYGACAQLWSFLAYDLVLLGPFLLRLYDSGKGNPPYKLNLIIYTVILLYSGAVAIYYLLINRTTRTMRVS